MNPIKKPTSNEHVKVILSSLWLFAVLNYLYCDVMTHMDPDALKQILTGSVGSIHITQGFLLQASFFMEIPIAMVLFSRILKYQVARWASIVAGTIMTAGQIASLFVGTEPTLYYIFFSTIEISCTVFIVVYAWRRPMLRESTPN